MLAARMAGLLHQVRVLLAASVVVCCDRSGPAQATGVVSAAPTPPPTASAPSSPVEATVPRCGPLECELFDSAPLALERVLEDRPLVVAVGEAHAQRGSEAIESTAKRFGRELLPVLAKHGTSDLVVELLLPDPGCRKATEKVRKATEKITEPQAETNQNEFVQLGHRSRELGVVPQILRPSCAEYDSIVAAGADGVIRTLEVVAASSQQSIEKYVQRNLGESIRAPSGPTKLVVAYGGLVHNDVVAKEGRESWSFGAALARFTNDRYVELDVIVPEYVKDTDTWKALAWYPHFDPKAHPGKVTLYRTAPRSYVMIYPSSAPSAQ